MTESRRRETPPLTLPDGVRMTPQRRLLLDLIAAWPGRFTALAVYEQARRRSPGLGLATVYRTVELLRRTGGVHPLRGDDDVPAYVSCRPGHHHHLVCIECGSVEETELCAAPSPTELKRRHGFAVAGHEVDLYGTCARCLAA